MPSIRLLKGGTMPKRNSIEKFGSVSTLAATNPQRFGQWGLKRSDVRSLNGVATIYVRPTRLLFATAKFLRNPIVQEQLTEISGTKVTSVIDVGVPKYVLTI